MGIFNSKLLNFDKKIIVEIIPQFYILDENSNIKKIKNFKIKKNLNLKKKKYHIKENLILVCTHGARDKRCGRAGPPLIKSLKEEIKKSGLSENYNTNHVY
jgi:hypothetical protein